jgi:hypothetical protein
LDLAYYHPDVVLEHALDPHVPLGPEAWLAIAGCLAAKPPELPRVAADLIVTSVEDGRFDAPALGEATAWLVDNDFAKVNRLEAPLRDVARVSPLHAAQVVRTIEGLLRAPRNAAAHAARAAGGRRRSRQCDRAAHAR